jgi:hypothetical protein
VQEGWVDYIAPQVYWSMGNKSANYSHLVSWWSDNVADQHLYIGQGVYKVNSDTQWRKRLEVPNQIRFNRSFSNVHGSILFSAKTLRNNPNQVCDALCQEVYQTLALVPNMPWKTLTSPPPPKQLSAQHNDNNTITLNWTYPYNLTSERDKARYFVVYRSVQQASIDLRTGQAIRATVVKTEDQSSFSFTDLDVKPNTKYNYTVSALSRLHNESQPTEVVSLTTTKKEVEIVQQPEKPILPLVSQLQSASPVQPELDEPAEEVDTTEEEITAEKESEDLIQIFPNPFNQQINIRYRLPQTAEVSLYVYDSRGTRVGALVVNKSQEAGNYSVNFNGQFLSDGTYYARLMAGEVQKTAKLILKR